MPDRLSDLLERIRPAGTPGAPVEGEVRRREESRERELIDVLTSLSSFEREAAAIVARARADAELIHRAALTRARAVRARQPERVAAAGAETVNAEHLAGERLRAEVLAAAEHHRDALRARAEDEMPTLVDEVVDAVWSWVDSAPDEETTS
jgi:vacuolar-type H+-ATPase subunit H